MASSRQNPIERDLMTIVGGYFSPDHIGAAYEQIARRVRASPAQYVTAFERRFLAAGVDPLSLADLRLHNFLKLIAERAPDQARALAARLSAVYAGGIPSGPRESWEAFDEAGEPDEDTRKRRRLERNLAALGPLTGPRA